ncbi:MAG: tetratricopeptide repeat protein, partial [Candidatus Glassbacteria bacterium]|nr:tetratricopeptide repeat protein [Candidatus Glassbacteria bacterium]
MKKILPILLLVCLASLPAAGEPEGRSADTVAVDMDVIGGPDTLKARISGLIRLGFERLERDDPESARKSFEAALSLDPGNVRAQVGLGRSYLEHKPGRVGIFELIERLFNQDFLSRAISCLNRALELDPDSWEAHYWLGSAYMKKLGRDDLERALEHMEQAYRLGGDKLQVRFKMALLHKALGDIQNAEQILFEINSEAAGRVDPLACLELVKINTKRTDFREAHRYYWRGVGSISTREEFQAYFDDLAVIATEDEHQDFLSTP